jgi:hypothetical protein
VKRTGLSALVLATSVLSAAVRAQQLPETSTEATATVEEASLSDTGASAVAWTVFDSAQAPSGDSRQPGGSAAGQFVRDVLSDYKNFFSVETALWLGIGGGAALGVHQADQSIANWAQTTMPSMPGGMYYGSQAVQIPVAIIWWIAGNAAGSENQASTGRDLLRAQLSAASWTYALKFATQRTRPNGTSLSFPSGHASTSFAVASVLQEHFGWKVGVPALLAAAYTGMSRIAQNDHWASDVVFGAALGMASGRTVTIRLRQTKVSMVPFSVPRGGGILLTACR